MNCALESAETTGLGRYRGQMAAAARRRCSPAPGGPGSGEASRRSPEPRAGVYAKRTSASTGPFGPLVLNVAVIAAVFGHVPVDPAGSSLNF